MHSVDYDFEYLEEAKIPEKFRFVLKIFSKKKKTNLRSNIDDVQNDQKHKIVKDYEASSIEQGHQQTQGKVWGRKFEDWPLKGENLNFSIKIGKKKFSIFHLKQAKDAGGQIEFVKRLPFLQESSPEVVEVGRKIKILKFTILSKNLIVSQKVLT